MRAEAGEFFDEDVTLMLAFQNGDEAAFDSLFRRYAVDLRRYFWRATGNDAAGEELVQETFLKIHRYKASYEPRAAFRTYLYAVARSILSDNWKRLKKQRAERDLAAVAEPAASHPGPEADVASREALANLEAAIATLPENQRTALVLVRYQGLSYQATATAMDTTVIAVKSLLNRARKHLVDRVKI